jgi:hypothetical protein
MPDKPSFDIWPKLHELAEKNVEQARSAYGQMLDFMTKALVAPSSVAPFPGLRAVQERSIEFARENAERFFTLESELAHVKDIQEAMVLQSAYVQAQMKAYALQVQELGRLLAVSMPAIGRTIAMP